jgi:hypothetical protein
MCDFKAAALGRVKRATSTPVVAQNMTEKGFEWIDDESLMIQLTGVMMHCNQC